MFQEALNELGLTKDDLSPLSFSFTEKGIREYVAFSIKQQIEECLGIQVELKPLPWDALFNKMTKGDFQMCLVQWTSRIDDAIYILNGFKSADLEINFSRWENSEFQSLLDESEKEVNPFQRSSLLMQAEEILCREMPIIPLYYQPAQALTRKDLQVPNRTLCETFYIARSSYKKEI